MLALLTAMSALGASGDGFDPASIPFVKLRSDVWEIVIHRTSPDSAQVERVFAKCGDTWVNACYAKHDSAFRRAVLTNVFRPEVRLEGDFQYCSSVVVDLPADMARRLVRPNTADLCAVIGASGPVASASPGPMGAPPEIRGVPAVGSGPQAGVYVPPSGLPDVAPGAPVSSEPLQARIYRAGDPATRPGGPAPTGRPPEPVGSAPAPYTVPGGPLIALDDDPRNVYQPRPDAPPPEPLDPELAALLGDVPTVGSQGALYSQPPSARVAQGSGALQGTPGSGPPPAGAPVTPADTGPMWVPDAEAKGSFGGGAPAGLPPAPVGSAPAPYAVPSSAPYTVPSAAPYSVPDGPLIALDDDPRNVYQPRPDAPPPEPLDPELAALLGDVPTVGSQGAIYQPAPSARVAQGSGAPQGTPGSGPPPAGSPVTPADTGPMWVPDAEAKGSFAGGPPAGLPPAPVGAAPGSSAPYTVPDGPLIALDDDPRNVYQPRPDAPPPEPLDPELAALLADVPTVGSPGAIYQPAPSARVAQGSGAPQGTPGSGPPPAGSPVTPADTGPMWVPDAEAKGSFGGSEPTSADPRGVPVRAGGAADPTVRTAVAERPPQPVGGSSSAPEPAAVDPVRTGPPASTPIARAPAPRGPDEFELEERDASQLERLSDRRRASLEAQETKKKRRKKDDEPVIEEVGGGRRYLVIELEALPEDEEAARRERSKKSK
ncbi:MAG: hypothetical protein R3F61_06710 [Myxococcota bacterium]